MNAGAVLSGPRALIWLDESGFAALQREGLTPVWLALWLRGRGAGEVAWRLATVDGMKPSAADWHLCLGDERWLAALAEELGLDARLALDDPPRRAWASGPGERRLLLMPAGGVAGQRARWLAAFAAHDTREVCVGFGDAAGGGMSPEPGLCADLGDGDAPGRCYTRRGELPEEALLARLREQGLRLRLVESCTGGAIAARLCRVSGASAVLDRGWVTYANAAKTEEVGVPAAMIGRHGAVSREVVEAMVAGAGEDCARIAVSGIAGPGGGSAEKPVGTVWIAVALPDETPRARRFLFAGGRAEIRHRATLAAMEMLLSEI